MHFRKKCRRRGRGCRGLKDYPQGSRICIKDIQGCPKDRCRLLALGLTPGTMAEGSANEYGSCCLRVRGADVILDDELADTISVSPPSKNEEQVA